MSRPAIPFPGTPRPIQPRDPELFERLDLMETRIGILWAGHEAHVLSLFGRADNPRDPTETGSRGIEGDVRQLDHDLAETRQWVAALAAFTAGVACAAALGLGLAAAQWWWA